MKLTLLNKRRMNYTILAFLLPFLGMLSIMLIGGYSPFGKLSMLYSDMYHQYYPFFKEFRRTLVSGESLLYNWSVGLGLDYLGLYSYYLASPLNLLSVLVPERWLLGYFSLLVPIKLGLASMFFSIMLNKLTGKKDISTTLFGCFYGMCAWALGYQWNVMWLDTFALLPLVILGMVALLRDRKFVLYTLTLFLSIYTNYYIGFFTCIFVFLVFFCYQVCRWQGFSKFFRDLGRIAIFSLLAIGMTAVLTIPTLAALQNTQSSVNKFPEGFNLNMTTEDNWKGLLLTMIKVAGNMNGGIEPAFKEGLPNLYCGVFTTVLAFLYLLCKQVRLRDKICAVFLLLFLNVSFIFRQLDYIWHGFHFTNMIPYRFSFLYSFVMLYMAYIAWINRENFRVWKVIVAAVAAIGITFAYEDKTDIVFWAYNGALLLLYISLLICYSIKQPKEAVKKDQDYTPKSYNRKALASALLLGVIGTEFILNLVNFGVAFPPTNASNYPKGTTDTAAVLDYMQQREEDNLFYRAETTHTQTLNDGALNGYHGVTTFTSSANVNVTLFMQALGYGAKNTYNRYSYEESSPVANLFLGVKYMLERDGKVEENPYFDDIYSSGKVHLLENNAYLPLGFLANSQLLNVDFSSQMNKFEFQNYLMQAAAGIQQDTWKILSGSSLIINGEGVSLTPRPTTGYCAYNTDETAGTITYSYTIDREGLLCVNLELSKKNSYSFRINGKELYSETYSLPQMLSVCTVRPGDVVDVKLNCKKNENGTIKISAAVLDETLFRRGYTVLSTSKLELTEYSNTRVKGTINCLNNGVLYTSIPQNGNWRAYVNGKEAETVTIGNAMVGLTLSRGTHEIEFVYHNSAFNLGSIITISCFVLFAGAYLIVYRPVFRSKKGKYEK